MNGWQPALGTVIVSFDPGSQAGDVEDVAAGQAAYLRFLSESCLFLCFLNSDFIFHQLLFFYLMLTSTVAAGRRDSKQMLGTHLSVDCYDAGDYDDDDDDYLDDDDHEKEGSRNRCWR